MTAMSISRPSAARVRSRSVVFPEPGDETRLIAVTPCFPRSERTSPAISLLRVITRSRTSILRTAIVDLQISHAQHIAGAAEDLRLRSLEGRRREHGLETKLETGWLDAG